MGSLGIEMMRNENPGKSDVEAAKAFAQKHGYIAIIRYKNRSATDFTNIGTCQTKDEIYGYLRSPYCHNAEILYDRRYGWIRHGKTYQDTDEEEVSKLGLHVKLTRVISYADLIKQNEPGTFTVCALEGKSQLVVKVAASVNDAQLLQTNIEAGRIVLRTSYYKFPMYPVIYNRLFIAIGSDPQPGRIRGILVESATDFTEANFQEWAVTLQRTQRIVINIYNDKEEHLGGAETVVNLETVNMIIEAIDQANKVLEAIPEEQRNFKTAAQAFFSEHPEPFLFD